MSWTHANLRTQGYCLSADEARSLRGDRVIRQTEGRRTWTRSLDA
jgi:hypothetical protein